MIPTYLMDVFHLITFSTTYLSFHDSPPSVDIPHQQINATVGQPITLTCSVQSPSGPVFEIKWIFRTNTGEIHDPVTTSPLALSNKYKGSTTSNASLTINDVQLSDQGEYRCWAKNNFGNNTSNMTKLSIIEISDTSTAPTINTATDKSTTDSLSSGQSTGKRPKRLQCSCPKRFVNTKWHFLDGKDISDAELRKLVLEDFEANIKPLITVKKKNISKAIRKRTSAENRRQSAQSVGSGFSVLLVVPVAFIIAVDLSRCYCSIRKNYHRNKTTRKCKISGLPKKTVIIEDDLYAVSGRVQQSKCLGNTPLDHHPRDMGDIHIKGDRSHAEHVKSAYDKLEVEDKTELSFSTNRQKSNILNSLDSNQSGNRKRVIFSSDEANPECDWKRASYEQRGIHNKKQRKSHRKNDTNK
ncbi:unnamed protein product [Mytilus coruscus]|uniref:Ig-like domain-containing protein n=1 Tax=Mytilus coruscus TaxID=42192 RepID=A0A6J8AMC1_MYTCO|nr:unnamed protein product [Mytilus coruscus]